MQQAHSAHASRDHYYNSVSEQTQTGPHASKVALGEQAGEARRRARRGHPPLQAVVPRGAGGQLRATDMLRALFGVRRPSTGREQSRPEPPASPAPLPCRCARRGGVPAETAHGVIRLRRTSRVLGCEPRTSPRMRTPLSVARATAGCSRAQRLPPAPGPARGVAERTAGRPVHPARMVEVALGSSLESHAHGRLPDTVPSRPSESVCACTAHGAWEAAGHGACQDARLRRRKGETGDTIRNRSSRL